MIKRKVDSLLCRYSNKMTIRDKNFIGGNKNGIYDWLAPAALVFSLSAIAQIGSLKKQIEALKKEIEKLKQ